MYIVLYILYAAQDNSSSLGWHRQAKRLDILDLKVSPSAGIEKRDFILDNCGNWNTLSLVGIAVLNFLQDDTIAELSL